MMARSTTEILNEMVASTQEPPRWLEWTWWDKLVHATTGRVTARVYEDRVLRMAEDDMRRERLKFELALANRQETRDALNAPGKGQR